MGESSKGIARSSRSENNWFNACEAHYVGMSPQEDRGGKVATVGEGEGCVDEGGIHFMEPCCEDTAAFTSHRDATPVCRRPRRHCVA
jgi:hypothetical protein